VMLLVLHHVPDPAAVLHEAARVLKPRGRFVLCDMQPHDREEYKHQMGHVWLGFAEDQLQRMLGAAGFVEIRIVPLPIDPAAKGPALFVLSAVRSQQ
jgi:ubiquinone/menaquinone biosynthesis C-methylase UbiE